MHRPKMSMKRPSGSKNWRKKQFTIVYPPALKRENGQSPKNGCWNRNMSGHIQMLADLRMATFDQRMVWQWYDIFVTGSSVCVCVKHILSTTMNWTSNKNEHYRWFLISKHCVFNCVLTNVTMIDDGIFGCNISEQTQIWAGWRHVVNRWRPVGGMKGKYCVTTWKKSCFLSTDMAIY